MTHRYEVAPYITDPTVRTKISQAVAASRLPEGVHVIFPTDVVSFILAHPDTPFAVLTAMPDANIQRIAAEYKAAGYAVYSPFVQAMTRQFNGDKS